MMNAIRSTIKSLRDWIADIVSATKEVIAEAKAEKENASPDLSTLLRDYMNLRKAERSDWSRYGQQKGTMDDFKAVSKAINYLREYQLFTLEDLDTALQGVNEKARTINADMKKASARMKVITGIQNTVADCQTHKAVHDKYIKIGWKVRQAAYAESHKDELETYNKAFRYLKKQGVDLNVNLDALQTEYDNLQASHTELAGQLATVKEELQPMKDIRYWVGKVLTPEQAEVEKKPEPKHSVTGKLNHYRDQKKQQPEQTTSQQQHKKQNMERTAQICEDNGMGYFDYAGNCWFAGHSIFLSEKGNKNQQPKEHRSVSIFERTSVVSSCILRELFEDVRKIWKLKHLAEKVECSIGQVSKLMKVLVENAWVEKVPDGYKIIDPESLLLEWSKDYGKKEVATYACYSLDNVSVIEERLKRLKKDMGIDSYLTGLSGGVRYASVVRYNKIYVYIAPENIREAISYLGMKEVSSGSNVVIFSLENDSYIKNYRVIGESVVVSPLQIYLDSMQIKGRGEEMAEAVLRKEILR